jgi:hypothetical protein
MDADGYYYRNAYNRKGIGPMTQRDLDNLKAAGEITDETKVWRQRGGQIYKLDIGRKFNKVFTFESCNHAFELIIIAITFFCTAFSMTLLDWKVLCTCSQLKCMISFSPVQNGRMRRILAQNGS